MKKSKLIVPALAMLVMSTAATVTGTVAWFSMNTAVSATNMKVKAASEGGIVISDSKTSEIWKSETASTLATKTLYPTSTVAGSVWYHASSDSDTDANGKGEGSLASSDYETLEITEDALQHVGFVDEENPTKNTSYDSSEKAYYLYNTVYIKSATVGSERYGLKVTDVNAEAGGTASSKLNAALRVLVKCGSVTKVFAPIGSTTTVDATHLVYTPGNAGQQVTAVDASGSFTAQEILSQSTKISADKSQAQEVKIYLYYEGEDGGCISANVGSNFDELTVSVKFEAISETVA